MKKILAGFISAILISLFALPIASAKNQSSLGLFDPITRCEVSAMLVEFADFDIQIPNGQRFPDLPVDHWCAKYAETLLQKDIIRGFADGTFKPDANINKAELAKLTVDTFKLPLVDPELPTYKDVPKDSWFYVYVETAQVFGIIPNSWSRYFPANSASRLYALKMIKAASEL